MISDILLYIGSGIITLWGISHLAATKSVVSGFGELSDDNRRIITMEWIGEGLALGFVGMLVLIVTLWAGSETLASTIVYRGSAFLLVIMAVLTAVTGARTSVIPFKICPYVKTAVAILFVLGTLL